jgi:hypothetical protein
MFSSDNGTYMSCDLRESTNWIYVRHGQHKRERRLWQFVHQMYGYMWIPAGSDYAKSPANNVQRINTRASLSYSKTRLPKQSPVSASACLTP